MTGISRRKNIILALGFEPTTHAFLPGHPCRDFSSHRLFTWPLLPVQLIEMLCHCFTFGPALPGPPECSSFPKLYISLLSHSPLKNYSYPNRWTYRVSKPKPKSLPGQPIPCSTLGLVQRIRRRIRHPSPDGG